MLTTAYNPLLVACSLIVAIMGSYTALDLANGIAVANGRARAAWLAAGALAMGVGIWSMHFVGMLAFRIHGVPISYDIRLVGLSTAVAILASGLALFLVSRRAVSYVTLLFATAAMGAAIIGMHYIGVLSMRMPAAIHWNYTLVAGSVAIAVMASSLALWLAFRWRFDPSRNATWVRLGGGVLMGLAIAGMHYTAMAAAHFVPVVSPPALPDGNLLATAGLGAAVTATTLLILAVAIAGSTVSRELARHTALAGATDSAHRATATAQARLRGIIDSALDAVVATDADGVIVEWSQHAESIFGWRADEVLGRSLTETVIPAEFRDRHRAGMQRYLTTGEARIVGRRIEISALRRDGRQFPIELAVTAVGTGSQILFTAFIRDLTEARESAEARRQGEERERMIRALELERSRLSALFEQASAFMALLRGPSHTVELANPSYRKLVGRDDITGKAIRDAVPELEGQGYLELLDQVFATGEPRVGVGSGVLLRPDAGSEPREHFVNFVYQPFRGPDGSVDGIFVHGVDVSDLVQARQVAEAASKAKNEFLSRMSHELRTPLNAILGFGQLMELEAVTDANRESAEQIVKGGRHLLALIDEVLEIARIEAGQMSLSVEPVPVAAVVGETVSLVMHMATKQAVAITVDVASCSDHHVLGDRQRLKQVLLNLLSNAIKYNRPGGLVTVTCRTLPSDRLGLVVEDTGRGMSPEQVGRLFTPFDRLGAERTAIEGSGLGLALSHGLMQAMGGTLTATSVEGEGTLLCAALPVVGAAVPAVEGSPREGHVPVDAADDRPAAARTVLVIEDNLANVRLMERVFQRRPHVRLLTAMQGTLGLDLAREHRPDLIMLDLNLPDLPGDRVLLALRQDPALRDIPVIMISGDAIPSQVQRLLELGVDAYLTKPFNLQELLQLVDERIGEHAG